MQGRGFSVTLCMAKWKQTPPIIRKVLKHWHITEDWTQLNQAK
jgi:hypothetical protein